MKKLLLFLFLLPSLAYAKCPDIDSIHDTQCDHKLMIVMFGDSITWGHNLSFWECYPTRIMWWFPDTGIRNWGLCGDWTTNGVKRLRSKLNTVKKPDYVIILEGINDYARGIPPVTTVKNLLAMKRIAEKTGAKVYLGELTPLAPGYPKEWLDFVDSVNRRLQPYHPIKFHSIDPLVSLQRDGGHPNAVGAQWMAGLAAERIISDSAL